MRLAAERGMTVIGPRRNEPSLLTEAEAEAVAQGLQKACQLHHGSAGEHNAISPAPQVPG